MAVRKAILSATVPSRFHRLWCDLSATDFAALGPYASGGRLPTVPRGGRPPSAAASNLVARTEKSTGALRSASGWISEGLRGKETFPKQRLKADASSCAPFPLSELDGSSRIGASTTAEEVTWSLCDGCHKRRKISRWINKRGGSE